MRMSLASLALLALVAGCGGSPASTDSGTSGSDAGRDAGSTGSDAGNDAGGAAIDTGPAEDTGPMVCPATFAGCTTLEDHTADTAPVVVSFAGSAGNFRYTPSCIRVRAGQTVTLPGAGIHPLNDASCSPVDSPIPSASTTGGSFTFSSVGRYGFFCSVHGTDSGNGMAGLIVVE